MATMASPQACETSANDNSAARGMTAVYQLGAALKYTNSLLYLLSAPTNSMSPKPSSMGGSNDLLIRSGCLVWTLPYHGAGTSEPPPADHGVSPSHPMDDQFWG